jgi:hypothetical protein
LLDPEVAVTLTVEIPAGVPVAGTPPPEVVAGGDASSLPQLATAITEVTNRAIQRV